MCGNCRSKIKKIDFIFAQIPINKEIDWEIPPKF